MISLQKFKYQATLFRYLDPQQFYYSNIIHQQTYSTRINIQILTSKYLHIHPNMYTNVQTYKTYKIFKTSHLVQGYFSLLKLWYPMHIAQNLILLYHHLLITTQKYNIKYSNYHHIHMLVCAIYVDIYNNYICFHSF